MTYNHGPYISKAIESVLMQKTNFMVELVIGDDFSSDDTITIIKRYSSTSNIDIKILDRQIGDEYWSERQKKGRLYNFINIIENCTGKYIALLDGDDYWTDPLKLQKQVDFMESNLEYSMCYHRVNLFDGNTIIEDKSEKRSEETTLSMARDIRIPTLSVLFRNVGFKLSKELIGKITGSHFLFMQLSEHGKIKFLDETMAVYRIHSGGIWSGKDLYGKANMQLANKKAMIVYFENNVQVKRELINSFIKISTLYFFLLLKQGKYRNAYDIYRRSFMFGISITHFIHLIKNSLTSILQCIKR